MKRKTELRVCPREWARLKDSIQTATESDGLPAIYSARATDLVAAILYDSRGSAANGRKWLDGETVVRLPANYFAKVFKNNAAARRMKKLLVDSGVIVQDGSWSNFEDKEHWADGYAVDYHPKTPPDRWITIRFPSSASILETALVRLRTVKADLLLHRDSSKVLHVDKKRLTADARSGKVDADDLAQFVGTVKKYPSLLDCYQIGAEGDRREYTPLTMVSKSLLGYIVDDSGNGLREVADLHSSFALTIPFALTATRPVWRGGKLVDMDGFTDLSFRSVLDSLYQGRVLKIDGRLVENPASDLYGKIIRHVEAKEPGTNLFHGCRSRAEKRERVKKEVQATLFAQEKEVKKWKTLKTAAVRELKNQIPVSKGKLYHERRARLRLAIMDFFESNGRDFPFSRFWQVMRSMVDPATGKHTPCFQLMTQGEAVLMRYVETRLANDYGFGDLTFYRKHDALLACVPPGRLPDDWNLRIDSIVFRILSALVAESTATTNNCQRLFDIAKAKGLI